MSSRDYSAFGDRMKKYESAEAQRRFLPLIPIVARIDGRTFSTFTADMHRPYDPRMSDAMVATTKWLVLKTNARVGYTQSDEISLAWHEEDPDSEVFFGGRVQKMVSQLAAMASVYFNHVIRTLLPEKYAERLPVFDARAWNVPNRTEAANTFLWREQDATKNAISMVAQSKFSEKKLHKKNGLQKKSMLLEEGIDFDKDFPAYFKHGTFIARRTVKRKFDAALDDLPEKHEARRNPDLVIERSEIVKLELPQFDTVSNRVGVLFDGVEPIIRIK